MKVGAFHLPPGLLGRAVCELKWAPPLSSPQGAREVLCVAGHPHQALRVVWLGQRARSS